LTPVKIQGQFVIRSRVYEYIKYCRPTYLYSSPQLLAFHVLPDSLHSFTNGPSTSTRRGMHSVNGIKIAIDVSGFMHTRSIPKDLRLHLEYDRVFISRRNG